MATYDDAAAAIAAWFEAGADSLHLVLPPGRPEAELVDVVAGAAREEALAPVAAVP